MSEISKNSFESTTLFKPVLGLIAAFVTSITFAQTADMSTTAISAPDASPKVAAVEAILGITKGKTDSAERASDFCSLDSSTKLPSRAVVVVVRKAPCVSRYGTSFNKDFLEVLYAGKTLMVPTDAVFLSPEQSKRLATLETAQIEASTEDWRLTSLVARKKELEQAMNAIHATSKYGVALLKASIFDVSEYTDGTGFTATVYNSTKKTIKYVTFTVVGLNAVGDPVRGGFIRRDATPMLRGIGPIAPGETGTYSKDYMWMTDVVESFRVSSVKLEYTDGSSKIVSDVKNIRIAAQDYEALTTDDD